MGMDPISILISSTTVADTERLRTMINSSRATISRISERDETPLISRLVINPINVFLNGTLNITCMELGTSSMAATTTLYITRNTQGELYI